MTVDAAGRSEAGAQDKMVLLNGLRFHYREWGSQDAPPLVLLHAYLMHARTWDTVARALAGHFRVLALDQRGFGESDWAADYHEQRLLEDLEAFVDALGLGAFAVAGISVGGHAAIGYAARWPDRVTRLVAFECFTEGSEPGDEAQFREMRAHLRHMRSLPESFATPAEAAAAFRPLAPYASEGELLHWMQGGLKQGSDGRWTWRYDPVFREPGGPGRLTPDADEILERLAQVRCPILLPFGAESWMVQPTKRATAVNEKARYIEIPRAGHWVPLDNPPGFLEAVDRFLTAGRCGAP